MSTITGMEKSSGGCHSKKISKKKILAAVTAGAFAVGVGIGSAASVLRGCDLFEHSDYTVAAVQSWPGHKNDSVWKSLRMAGWTNRQIVNNNLVDQVARINHLKNPNLVYPGQNLQIPN